MKPFLFFVLVAGVLAGYRVGLESSKSTTVIKLEKPRVLFESSVNELLSKSASGMSSHFNNRQSGELLLVNPGESIQEAVLKAQPGTVIKVFPGEYRETVYVDKDDITLSGVIEQGAYPILHGERALNDAILYSGNGFTVENFFITGYKGNAIMGQAGNNFIIRGNVIEDTGVYGIFPQLGKNGIIAHNVVSGIEDAAIYVGMSENVDVVYNEVFDSVAGIEIENTKYALVEGNNVYNNTGGILAFITPGLPIKTCSDVIIRNNYVRDNNHENFAAVGSLVSNIPEGTGIMIMACDDVIIEGNVISGNDSIGITLTDFSLAANTAKDPDSDPNPDRPKILSNVMRDNGSNPTPFVRAALAAMLKTEGQDIVDTIGLDSGCILYPERHRSVGISEYQDCPFVTTMNLASYTLSQPVPPHSKENMETGMLVYYGVCAGCHAYNSRLIGPSVRIIQARYTNNPQGVADYAARPVKIRPDFPEMPPQSHLDNSSLFAAASFLLELEK